MKFKFAHWVFLSGSLIILAFIVIFIRSSNVVSIGDAQNQTTTTPQAPTTTVSVWPPLDTAAYDTKLREIANLTLIEHVKTIKATTSTPTSTIISTSTIPIGWPVKTTHPLGGALLPFKRIVAYYGNFYSTQMGILGAYPQGQVLSMLASTTAEWEAADPTTPVVPAIDYIAVTAQASAGPDRDYNARMPDDQIEQAIHMAQQVNGIVFLDVQVGLSNVRTEIPLLERYLKMPEVHLAIDPEFAMHDGARPGTVIGMMDAADINYAATYLAHLVQEYDLPPKILVVHRFTEAMVTNYQEITPLPEVQIVMDMDGFGPPWEKLDTYHYFIQAEPVQFTGFKLFYKNDAKAGHLMTPEEVLKLSPQPSYIQYE